jgi:hypothetical protein
VGGGARGNGEGGDKAEAKSAATGRSQSRQRKPRSGPGL